MVLVWLITDDSPNLPNFSVCQIFPLYSNKIALEKFSVTDQAAKLTKNFDCKQFTLYDKHFHYKCVLGYSQPILYRGVFGQSITCLHL